MQTADWRSLFPEASDEQWRDWRWQMRHAVRTPEQLARLVPLTEDERRGCEETAAMFRLGISPYYLSLVDREHPFCPVRMQADSHAAPRLGSVRASCRIRSARTSTGRSRPSSTSTRTGCCSSRSTAARVYCRHCTRRRITKGGEAELGREAWAKGIAYVRAHPEVRDVLDLRWGPVPARR